MKKNIVFLFLIISIVPRSAALAISPTLSPTASPTLTPLNLADKLKKINILKEKIATKVAQIRNQEKSALSGLVNSTLDNQIILSVPKKGNITVSFNEDTHFYSLEGAQGRVDLSAKKIKEGSYLTVFGYFQQEEKNIEAKIIYQTNPTPIHIIGKIADLDRKNFTIAVITPSQEDWAIDIETYTKTFQFTKTDKIQKSGFSKLIPGDLVSITAIPNPKEKNRASSLRILVLSDFSSSTKESPTKTQISPTPK